MWAHGDQRRVSDRCRGGRSGRPGAIGLSAGREFLRTRIETAGIPPRIVIGDEIVHGFEVLPTFYEARAYQPAWSTARGPLPRVEHLIQALREAEKEGLVSTDYHLKGIEALREQLGQGQPGGGRVDLQRVVDLDLLATDAFLVYASHLLWGRVNPETFDSGWHVAHGRGVDVTQLLHRALEPGQVGPVLRGLLPPQSGYSRLREALAAYRGIAGSGGWPAVADRPKLQLGDQGERVAALRQRLELEDTPEAASPAEVSEIFDEPMERAVRRFQMRHGLDTDGVVGRDTLQALNIPAAARARQIELTWSAGAGFRKTWAVGTSSSTLPASSWK
jgi:murein L,D-transpeptidase YcbB/YkuD